MKAVAFGSLLLFAACEGPHAPERPTWADVEPILRVQCNHCHGSTARTTGAVGSLVYRFDFYEMTEGLCGEAAQALETQGMAHGWATLIKSAVTPARGERARMPPAPAPALSDWERQTLQRWADRPMKGAPSRENRRPQITVSTARLPSATDPVLDFIALVEDPDGESVVGVLQIGDRTLKLDRPGSFAVRLDTSTWEEGMAPVRAVLCDGWDSFTYDLGRVRISR